MAKKLTGTVSQVIGRVMDGSFSSSVSSPDP